MFIVRDAQTANKVIRRQIDNPVNLIQRRAWFDGEGETEDTPPTGEQVFDWSKVNPADIPETLVKAHPRYKEVLDETIKRRQDIKALKEGSNKQEDVKTAPDANTELAELLGSVKNIIGELQQAKQENEKTNILAATGLPETVYDRLRGDTYAEKLADAQALAATLGIKKDAKDATKGSTPKVVSSNPANPSTANPNDAMLNRVLARMTGGGGINPFDPGAHMQMGGGVINDLKD